ncbi:MAG: peptidylprolyl isomerase, partial [Bacteroidota bacterium]
MALIGKIRENSWFLIAAIVLGMGGFLFMDMIGGSRGSSLMGTQNLVGKIEGEKIQIDQFQRRERAFYGGARGDVNVQRENFWNFLVEETLLGKEGEAIGLQVGEEELRALFDGEDAFISPTVRQEFANPQTGQFDVNLVRQYLDTDLSAQPQVKAYIDELKNRVAREKMADKLNNLVSKSMFTPTWQAESIFAENNVGVSFSYVTIPYTAIPDSEAAVSDDDIKNYIKANPVAYTDDEETRSISWVEFPVSPTATDSTEIEKRMTILVNQFSEIEDDTAFTTENYGFYNTEYVTEDEISVVVIDSLKQATPGTVVGPYLDAGKSNGDPSYQAYGFYKAVKLIDRKVVPDSVDTRHILIRVENPAGNPTGVEGAIAQLDSVKMFIEERDSTFERMAEVYGQDGTAQLGGEVGMMGPKNLLPEYRNAVFYEANEGDLLIVTTSAGVHLIEVLDQKFSGIEGYRVAYVEEVIVPSDDTQKEVYNDAFEFVRANRTFEALNQAALEAGLNTRSETGIRPNDYQVGDQTFDPIRQQMV